MELSNHSRETPPQTDEDKARPYLAFTAEDTALAEISRPPPCAFRILCIERSLLGSIALAMQGRLIAE